MSTRTFTFNVAAPPTGSPAYVGSMDLYRWYKIGGPTPDLPAPYNTPTNLASAVLLPSRTANPPWKIWASWNGFSLSMNPFVMNGQTYGQHGALFAWGGGHWDYQDTEFYIWDIASRTWVADARARPVSTTINPVTGLFDNGAPGPFHTYHHSHVRTLTGEIVQPNSDILNGGLGQRVAVRRYNPTTGTWSGGSVEFGAQIQEGQSAYDEITDRTITFNWVHAGNQVARYYDHDTDNGTYGTFTLPFGVQSVNPSATVPPANGRTESHMVMVTNLTSVSYIRAISFTNPTAGYSANSTFGGYRHPAMAYTRHPLLYSPAHDALFALGENAAGMANLCKIPCPANTINGTWTGQDLSTSVSFASPMEEYFTAADLAAGSTGFATFRKACLATFPDGKEMIVLSGLSTHHVYGMRIN